MPCKAVVALQRNRGLEDVGSEARRLMERSFKQLQQCSSDAPSLHDPDAMKAPPAAALARQHPQNAEALELVQQAVAQHVYLLVCPHQVISTRAEEVTIPVHVTCLIPRLNRPTSWQGGAWPMHAACCC